MRNAILAALLALATLSPLYAGTPVTVTPQAIAQLRARLTALEAQEAAFVRQMQAARTRATYEYARQMLATLTRESRQASLAYKAALARR